MRAGVILLGCDAGRSGIGRYAAELLTDRPNLDIDVVYPANEVDQWTLDHAAHRIEVKGLRGAVAEIFWTLFFLPWVAWRRRWDVAFFPAGNRRLPYWMPCPVVGTVHDVSSLHVPNKYGRLRSFYVLRLLPALIRRLDRVLTVSETSAVDIEESTHIPREAVAVIPNGVDHSRFHAMEDPGAAARVQSWVGRAPYFLYVSRIEHPGKNHVMLIEAFEAFCAACADETDVRLILAGPDRENAHIVHKRIAASPVSHRIRTPGFVPEGDLPQLYRGAAATFVPSLYEGFGIPAIEAMAVGTRLWVSDCPALQEVVASAAESLPADSAPAWADAMATAVRSDDLPEARDARLSRARGFSWDTCRRDTWRQILSHARPASKQTHSTPCSETEHSAGVSRRKPSIHADLSNGTTVAS